MNDSFEFELIMRDYTATSFLNKNNMSVDSIGLLSKMKKLEKKEKKLRRRKKRAIRLMKRRGAAAAAPSAVLKKALHKKFQEGVLYMKQASFIQIFVVLLLIALISFVINNHVRLNKIEKLFRNLS